MTDGVVFNPGFESNADIEMKSIDVMTGYTISEYIQVFLKLWLIQIYE